MSSVVDFGLTAADYGKHRAGFPPSLTAMRWRCEELRPIGALILPPAVITPIEMHS